ncbi:MAG: 2,3-bisphosphoglycerate-independent phosphoglycerate mutase [bacterium]
MTNREEFFKDLSIKTDSKIVLLVIDGLGGLPIVDGKTELEAARRPNLDALAKRSVCGLTHSVSPGITPGSGPGHLAIFGYDPMKYEIGRGILEALGIGVDVGEKDLAIRGNYATRDEAGIITDRRAGRIPTEKNEEICQLLQERIRRIGDVEVFIYPGKEHRFVLIFRGEGLEDRIADADPQKDGKPMKYAEALDPGSKRAADVVNKFIDRVSEVLRGEHPANAVLLRGFAKYPRIPSMSEVFKLTPAAIANYPMYRGLAKLVGMELLPVGPSIGDEFEVLKANFDKYDFFFVHVKKTDSYGEDGDYRKKIEVIEEVDRFIPAILDLNPDVVAVTADHSTPAALKSHSWHPNPFMLYSKYVRPDDVDTFTERACARGGLGTFYAVDEVPLMLANALKLNKFGA